MHPKSWNNVSKLMIYSFILVPLKSEFVNSELLKLLKTQLTNRGNPVIFTGYDNMLQKSEQYC